MLASFRIQWIKLFNQTSDSVVIANGELDLREWDTSEGGTIQLNGEWEFFPYEHIINGDSVTKDGVKKYIQVPGNWSETLNGDRENPYGYGSYRLRILVEPNQDQAYRVQVPSVRSASALYVNGLFSGQSGKVADNEEEVEAFNVPYLSSTIRANEEGVIELVLQATNYVDPRSSGLVRSIKFGYEENIIADTNLSIFLQAVSATIFIVIAIFACILYMIGIRDTRLIYFAIVFVIMGLSSLMGSDEKVLLNYFKNDYKFTFKFAFLFLIVFGWAMTHCVKPQIDSLFKPLLPIYSVISLSIIVVILFLPVESFNLSSGFSLSYAIVSALITAVALLFGRKEFTGGIWLAFSCVALASHFGWWIYSMNTGLKVIYYPFDLIIAAICFAGVWFKQYHEMHLQTKKLAMELQEADKVKDEFLINTSHELRNPLHSILNMSEAILEREQKTLRDRSVRDLETVILVSRRMSAMVNELLDLKQIEEGNPRIQIEPCSLQAITVGVIDMLKYKVEGKPVQFINDVPAQLPLIMADEKRMIQILFNLMHNAVKFTNQGIIRIQAIQKGNHVEIRLSDTGSGISEDIIRSIFEPYVQENAREGGGFGLGLNISRKLVESHNSKLEVQSIVNEGSTFWFDIPLANLDPVAIKQSDSELKHPSNMLPINGEIASTAEKQMNKNVVYLRILVVDDDPINLQVIESMLCSESYEITMALSGQEALNLLNEKEWDLVISDVMMPKMSGYDLTKRIRERFSRTELPILLLTARSESIDINNGFLAGANDYVTKPVDAIEFKTRVHALAIVRQSIQEKLQVEAAWLQAQIQPHFLFNALNTIIALSEIDVVRMQKVLEAFSQLLRAKFTFNELDQMVPIEKELQIVQSYLYIEQERFAERLYVHWEVEENTSFFLPSLTIQPLVENAVHHGIMKRSEGGSLTIQVLQKQSYFEIIIEDDGIGMEREVVENLLDQTTKLQSGIGLLNTDLRLKRKYGQGLQIKSMKGVGTTISFRIPR